MLPAYAVQHRVVIVFCVFLIVVGGIWSYLTMGRLEDPEFTINTALVVTLYPGATAEDVEDHVTNVVERAAQQIQEFKKIRSISKPGVSFVLVDLNDGVDKIQSGLIWQDLRNKLNAARPELPIEALTPIVKDDFGDVYGIVLALSADGFSDSELRETAKDLQKELLLIDQVRRIELWGVPEERIEIQISQARMAELNIHPLAVILALQSQNLTSDTGIMTIGGEKVRISPSGTFQTIEEIENLILPDGSMQQFVQAAEKIAAGTPIESILSQFNSHKGEGTRQIRLRDIATVQKVLNDEPSKIMRSDGKKAIAIALSPIPNGDVIQMGEKIKERLDEILKTLPAGYQIDVVSYQPDNVNVAIHAFTKNLYEAIIIVTLVVMVAMGWKSGLLITSSLLIVMLGTFCVLAPMGIVLHRTSLGAFIVALGILVDDAVVVGDLILVRMERGMDRMQACIEGAKRAAPQLLGATVVGALAFWPVYLSNDKTGEYAGTLFVVLAISLMISWIVAMTQTPVIYYLFVKPNLQKEKKDPHSGPVYRMYRRLLELTLHHKTITLGCLIGLLFLAFYGFQQIPQIFFPRAQRAQFMIDYWLPEGTSINTVSDDVAKIEEYLLQQKGVQNVGSFIGAGPPRFYLPYEPELPNSSYAQIVVNVNSLADVDRLIDPTEQWLHKNMPQAESRAQRFALGPTTKLELEARFSGPDPGVLQNLADQAKEILQKEPTAKFIRDDWRQMVPTWSPTFSQPKGSRALVARNEMMFALRWATKGIPTATFSDHDDLLPVIVRSNPLERNNTETLMNTPVWGHLFKPVPLSQVSNDPEIIWENGQIHRRDRFKTITVGADANGSDWSGLMKKVRSQIEAIELPPGYSMEWGGQFEQSEDASKELLGKLPIALIFMAIIVVVLFNALRQPLIILLTFPLATIGITFGMILLNKPFGFMALIGAMSLLGMMVRNGVVLMDQIDEELAKGESPYYAIVDASVERMRPVTVAAMTVIVGMIPLLQDPLFDSMATAIMFGLIFATILTLFVVPIFYMIFFRVKLPD
ncbi:MAG: efflux RND transporter permease subunit [Planctomycetia bacterium]|nr:efflux RND transporter permease subunit [Planctomycetia bacterium]